MSNETSCLNFILNWGLLLLPHSRWLLMAGLFARKLAICRIHPIYASSAVREQRRRARSVVVVVLLYFTTMNNVILLTAEHTRELKIALNKPGPRISVRQKRCRVPLRHSIPPLSGWPGLAKSSLSVGFYGTCSVRATYILIMTDWGWGLQEISNLQRLHKVSAIYLHVHVCRWMICFTRARTFWGERGVLERMMDMTGYLWRSGIEITLPSTTEIDLGLFSSRSRIRYT